MKAFLLRLRHAWPALYFFIYMPAFFWLERTFNSDYPGLHYIHCTLDDKIPFVEHFIIPYFLWYFYIAGFVVFFFFKDVKEFYQLMATLIIGMTVFLIISAIYPNGVMIRPDTFPRENVFTDMVRQLHSIDTDTNVFPSLHAFNSIAVAIAVLKSKYFKDWGVMKISSTILALLIIFSTVFLKQHSIIDVIGSFVLAVPLYLLVYVKKWNLCANHKRMS